MVREPANKQETIKLSKPHWHGGKLHAPGAKITVNARQATRLVEQKQKAARVREEG